MQILIDSHLHLWDPEKLPYPWLDDVSEIQRAFSVADYDAEAGLSADTGLSAVAGPFAHAGPAAAAGGFVFVECTGSMRDDIAKKEVQWVESLAHVEPRIQGIVAHASLENGDEVQPHLKWLASRDLVKGVRRLLQGEKDPRFCVRPSFLKGVRHLAVHSLPFDVCVFQHQLPAVVEMARSVPEVQFVLDHAGKPAIKSGELGDWRHHMDQLAALPNVMCKLSGLLTEADHAAWSSSDILPIMQHVVSRFGPDRLLYGSDWPVVLLAGTLSRWNELVFELLASLSTEKQEAILGLNAKRVYGL